MALFYALNKLDSTQYTEVRLILGDQLNASHSWFGEKRENVLYVMMEMRQETDYATHHIQKVLAFFAAMRSFAKALSDKHDVLYITLDHQGNKQTLTDNLDMVLNHCHITSLLYQAPDEWRLDEQLAQYSRPDTSVSMVDTEHFYTQRDALSTYFKSTDNLLMENFYRRIRKSHGYLMEGDKPKGGKWNYDHDNRKKLPSKVEVPDPLLFDNEVTDIYQLLQQQGIKTIGKVARHDDDDNVVLGWPINRKQSRRLLAFFIEHCLPDFGRYQDALSERGWSLFHARLSFSMNSKMLSPREVVESAIKAHDDNPERVNLAQIEGFVRQIIGWREYIRAIYWAKMPDYAQHNKLQHQRQLPGFYWSADTKMACMRHAISQSLEQAYAHHIQRLMVTGNFALLAGVNPDEVDAWYLGIYIDAIEWVELPNTRGMSQFADGGILATKPYVSGGNYINKMSHYCKDCHYNVSQKHGQGACPFNVLYWHFIDRHKQRFANNHRMSMMYRQWDKRDAEERKAILNTAENYLIHIQEL
ncbi:MAG: cryptochrome/photolyase family protein [Idiomarina sp.]|nr:cryptochrome/photolyase family protein [Idiomarina sp.]